MQRAVRSDPTSFSKQLLLRNLLNNEYGLARGTRMFRALAKPDYVECAQYDVQRDYAALHRMANGPARVCAAFVLAADRLHTPAEWKTLAEAAHGPFTMNLTLRMSNALEAEHRPRQAEAIVRAALTEEMTPRERANAMARLAYLKQLNDPQRALEYQTALEAAIQRSAYAAAPYWYAVDRAASLGRVGRSRDIEDAARLAQRHGAYSLCAHASVSLMNSYIDNGAMREAIRLAPLATSCADRSPNDELKARARIWHGRALLKSGDPVRAIPIIQSAGPAVIAADFDYNRADYHHNLTHAFEAKGDRRASEVQADSFVVAARKLADSPLRVVSLRDAGIVYWDGGKRTQARRYFDELVALVDVVQHDQYWAGEYFERVGDLENARKYYRAGLAMQGDSARKTAALTRIYLALGSIDSAAAMAALHDSLPQTPEEVPLVPVLQAARGDYTNAIRRARAWAEQQQRQGNLVGTVNAQLQVADFAQAAGDTMLMKESARRALQLARGDSMIEPQARALALLGRYPEALRLARRADNPAVLADVWTALAAVRLSRAAFDSALVAHRRTSAHFEQGFDRVRYRNPAAALLARAAAHARDANDLFEWSVRRKAERAPRIALAAVQHRLGANAALIDYTITDSTVTVLLVTATSTDVVRLNTTRQRIRSLVEDLRRPTATRFGALDLARVRYDHTAARNAYDVLLRPLGQRLAGKSIIYVAPDDALHFIPFDGLLDGEAYVIDRAAVGVIAAADGAAARSVSLARVRFVAGHAPGVADEIAALKALVPARSGLDQGASVLHIATHASADAARPLSSYFEMNGKRVFVNEIERLQLSSDLVVFTACETVYGKLYSGGPFGLANAFRTAGAKSVVATLWPVGAASAEFTKTFYSEMKSGVAPVVALHRAKLELKRRSENPLLWAPYVMIAGAGAGAGLRVAGN